MRLSIDISDLRCRFWCLSKEYKLLQRLARPNLFRLLLLELYTIPATIASSTATRAAGTVGKLPLPLLPESEPLFLVWFAPVPELVADAFLAPVEDEEEVLPMVVVIEVPFVLLLFVCVEFEPVPLLLFEAGIVVTAVLLFVCVELFVFCGIVVVGAGGCGTVVGSVVGAGTPHIGLQLTPPGTW